MEPVLDSRALNRALLERQMLAGRRKISVAKALEHLVGMQSQVPDSPYYGLWSRLADFRAESLSSLIERRGAVRIALMRSTIHLVTSRDCLDLRPVLDDVQIRSLYVGGPFGRNIEGMSLDDLVARGRALLEETPRTIGQLGKALAETWPKRDPTSLGYAIRNLVPMVQIPPRGLWRTSGQTRCTTAEAWLGRSLGTHRAPNEMIKRYLAAFGPATVKDVEAWSGLRGLREHVEGMGLRVFRDGKGSALYDLPRAPRPDASTAVPPRFLPDFDNALLAHADRSRVFATAQKRKLPIGKPTFLVDGFVAGTWAVARQKRRAVLTLSPFERLASKDVAALTAEGAGLLAFAAAEAETREVRVLR